MYYHLLLGASKTFDFQEVIFNAEAQPIRKTWKIKEKNR
jgi:hypothetical protein